MSTILASRPGEAVAVVSDSEIPLSIDVDGLGGFLALSAIITDFDVDLGVNCQVRPSLSNVSHLFVFGDEPGTLRLSGILFSSRCDGPKQSGFEALLSYFDENKASARELPVQVQIGVSPEGLFRCALTRFSGGMQSQSRFGRFALTLKTFPRANPRFYVDGVYGSIDGPSEPTPSEPIMSP